MRKILRIGTLFFILSIFTSCSAITEVLAVVVLATGGGLGGASSSDTPVDRYIGSDGQPCGSTRPCY